MHFEYTPVENVFFQLGFLFEQVIVLQEVLDHREMIERIVLEVIQIFLHVVLHQLAQLVVNFEENSVYLLVVYVRPILL